VTSISLNTITQMYWFELSSYITNGFLRDNKSFDFKSKNYYLKSRKWSQGIDCYQIIIDGPAKTRLDNVDSFVLDVLAEINECFSIAEFCCLHLKPNLPNIFLRHHFKKAIPLKEWWLIATWCRKIGLRIRESERPKVRSPWLTSLQMR